MSKSLPNAYIAISGFRMLVEDKGSLMHRQWHLVWKEEVGGGGCNPKKLSPGLRYFSDSWARFFVFLGYF